MLSYKENVRAILECHFSGMKDEIIDNAVNTIMKLGGSCGGMTTDGLIVYCTNSIIECDTFKDKYRGNNDHLATVFEGMSEAYCDILNRLLGRSANTPITHEELIDGALLKGETHDTV